MVLLFGLVFSLTPRPLEIFLPTPLITTTYIYIIGVELSMQASKHFSRI